MSYWIFVHKSEFGDTIETFEELIKQKNWGLPSSVGHLSEKFQSGVPMKRQSALGQSTFFINHLNLKICLIV